MHPMLMIMLLQPKFVRDFANCAATDTGATVCGATLPTVNSSKANICVSDADAVICTNTSATVVGTTAAFTDAASNDVTTTGCCQDD